MNGQTRSLIASSGVRVGAHQSTPLPGPELATTASQLWPHRDAAVAWHFAWVLLVEVDEAADAAGEWHRLRAYAEADQMALRRKPSGSRVPAPAGVHA